MKMPPDHTAALMRTGFPIPPGADWSAAERDLLDRYGYWMTGLADGTLAPVTPEQEHFVAVARGSTEPKTPFELAWIKNRQTTPPEPPPVGPLELADRLSRLQAARAAAAAVKDEYAARRQAILDRLKPELEALDEEYGPRISEVEEAAVRADADARAAVLAYGSSFKVGGVHAVYARGRVTWDSKGLAEYAEEHPELESFKKVGEPTVSLRFDAAVGE